eukprot:14988_1
MMIRDKSIKYEKVNLNSDEEKLPHPLESKSFCIRIMHYVFHIWIFNLMKQKPSNTNDIPTPPTFVTVEHSHKEWMKIYKKRKNKHLSTTTLSMIYHTEQYT